MMIKLLLLLLALAVSTASSDSGSVDVDDMIENFDKWVDDQERRGSFWMTLLKDCPCNVSMEFSYAISDSDTQLNYFDLIDAVDPINGWVIDDAISRKGKRLYHSQQCCYDDDGTLITFGLGSGTPDYANSLIGHYKEDLLPWLLAAYLDRNIGTSRYMDKYLHHRLSNLGDQCNSLP